MAYPEEYPVSHVIWSNLVCLIALLIAFFGMYPILNGLVSAAHILVFILLWLALRKSVCSACYYYDKRCGTGWGKIASFFYKKTEKEEKIAPKLAFFTWVVWFAVVPAIVLLYLTIAQFSYYQLGMLLLFCIMVGAHMWLHKKCCPHCRERMAFISPPVEGKPVEKKRVKRKKRRRKR